MGILATPLRKVKTSPQLMTLLLLSVAYVTLAWSGHEVYTYLLARSLGGDGLKLDELVPISPYSYNEGRIYNTPFYFTDDFAGRRAFFDPLNDGRFPPDPAPVDGRLPAWQILSIYAQFPDFGMDEGLTLSPLQVLIGNSQGVRHMRYKLGPLEVFEGDLSFLHFVNMSQRAFQKGDRYWGYRFLSYALHYLQDLFQPYHASPGDPLEVARSIFDRRIRNLLNNAHFAYDNYLIYLILYSSRSGEVVKLIEETPPLVLNVEPRQLVNEVMAYAYAQFPIVHSEVKRVFGDILAERSPSIDEFQKLEAQGVLENLYSQTLLILRTMTAVVKGFLVRLIN